MNKIANEQRSHYIIYLKEQFCQYMAILEQMFGLCDPRFVFGSFKQAVGSVPRTHFPNGFHFKGNCVVDIHISKYPWQHCCYDQSAWQVAHECVHLLDPGLQTNTNVLEEGLATWFQNEPRFHNDLVKTYIRKSPTGSQNYIQAGRLVQHCMPNLIKAIKDIRGSGLSIRDITPDTLNSHLSEIDGQVINDLCSEFQYRRRSIL